MQSNQFSFQRPLPLSSFFTSPLLSGCSWRQPIWRSLCWRTNAPSTARRLVRWSPTSGRCTRSLTCWPIAAERSVTAHIQFKIQIPIWHSQYHGCWCPGDARSQDISIYDISYVKPEEFGSRTLKVNVLYLTTNSTVFLHLRWFSHSFIKHIQLNSIYQCIIGDLIFSSISNG